MRYLLFILLIFNSGLVHSQAFDGSEMDFWVGNWELTWLNKDSVKEKGINKIEKILNDKVIQENFEATQGSMAGYSGKSFSAYNPQNNTWFQTWVDSQGGYLPFEFKMEGDNPVFYREVKLKDQAFLTRMIFHSIKKDSFIWEWQRSDDNGASWTTNWKINYKRMK